VLVQVGVLALAALERVVVAAPVPAGEPEVVLVADLELVEVLVRERATESSMLRRCS
jgi:hypothetical protein